MTGCFTFISYAVYVFTQLQANIDPNASSILLAVMQIFGNLCSSQFADVLGRKFILIVSLLGTTVGLSSLASYSYFVSSGFDLSAYAWIPVISLSFVIFIGSAGIVPLLGVCVVENLPLKVILLLQTQFFFIWLFFVVIFLLSWFLLVFWLFSSIVECISNRFVALA